ncbi:MAG: TIGR03986 family type III CRISPR-associated RAMP protein [Proteocatella sp.]
MQLTREAAMTPYNFIPFPKNVIYRYDKFENLPSHGFQENNKLKSGCIEYTVESKSPLFIGNGNQEFFNIDGEYMIPGSSIRGRVRTNAEILSYAKPQFIGEQTFWYRALADKSIRLRNEYTEDLKNRNKNTSEDNKSLEDVVQAGYLIKKGNRYEITPAKKDNKNRYFQRVGESRLREMSINNENKESIFMYKNMDWEKINDLKRDRKNQKKYNKDQITRKIDNIFRENKRNNRNDSNSFKPYSQKVWYRTDETGTVIDISSRSHEDWKRGHLANSSNLGNKQVHYLIFEDSSESLIVPREVISNFNVNVKYRDVQEKNLYGIRREVNKKPIFYKINSRNQIEVIGFTPYLKIPYKNSILSGVRFKNLDNEKVDYVQAMFGMTETTSDKKKTRNYKSRLIFDNLKLETAAAPNNEYKLPLMNPNPKSFQLYLKQSSDDLNNLVSYNNEFDLNGYKFYYLKNDYHLPSKEPSGNYISTIKPLENVKFRGKVYFKNLNDDELGLLLTAIEPFKSSLDNLGQGKPFGFGKVKITVEKLLMDQNKNINKKSYDLYKEIQDIISDSKTTQNIYDDVKDIDYYKKEFKEEIKKLKEKYGNEDTTDIIEMMNYSKLMEVDYEKYQYMNVKRFSEREVLPSINQLQKPSRGNSNKNTNVNVSLMIEEIKNAQKRINQNQDKTMYESYVMNSKSILVLSKLSADEVNVRKILNSFRRVDYKQLNYNSFDSIRNISKYDIIIFNNYNGSKEKDENGLHYTNELEALDNLMNSNKDKAYLYFNTRRQNYMGNFDGVYHYSSTNVTLFNAVIDLARYEEDIR